MQRCVKRSDETAGPRRGVRRRTAAWSIVPLVELAIVPWLLLRASSAAAAPRCGVWWWAGCWLIADGFGLLAWCVAMFVVQGRGTPLPLDPPVTLVACGPYRYVRNPMALAMLMVLLGEALVFRSWLLGGYAAALALAMHALVCRWEEPALAARFGDAYAQYRQRIPRWMPSRGACACSESA